MKFIYICLLCSLSLFCFDVKYSFSIENKINECSKITDDNDRLKCFDNIVNNLNKESNLVDNLSDDKWISDIKESKLDNSKTIYFIKKSENELPNQIGKNTPVDLVIRCANNTTETYISWPSFLGINDVNVSYKIDDGKINKSYWNVSTDHKAVFSKNPIKFLKELNNKKILIIQLTPHSFGPQEAEFNLSGIDKVIDKISNECKWKK